MKSVKVSLCLYLFNSVVWFLLLIGSFTNDHDERNLGTLLELGVLIASLLLLISSIGDFFANKVKKRMMEIKAEDLLLGAHEFEEELEEIEDFLDEKDMDAAHDDALALNARIRPDSA